MLIQPDKALLGDKVLRDKEAIAQKKEQIADRVAKDRIPDQDILEDQAAALGKPMQPGDFIVKLQNLNPRIKISKGGMPNAVAVRYPLPENGVLKDQYITGFFVDAPLPEFSAVVTDNRGLPWREIRGWRSVLLALIRRQILTKKQIETTFGFANGSRAILWDKQTTERSFNN